jgi:hypothetical protein
VNAAASAADVDALMDVRDIEEAKLNEIVTMADAERVVDGARMADLVATQKAPKGCRPVPLVPDQFWHAHGTCVVPSVSGKSDDSSA